MSDIGPAQAEPKSEAQEKAKALRDAEAAEREAKNTAKAAHDANEANAHIGLYAEQSTRDKLRQDAATAERSWPENQASDANADAAEAKAKETRDAAAAALGEEAEALVPPEPEYDPNVEGRGKR